MLALLALRKKIDFLPGQPLLYQHDFCPLLPWGQVPRRAWGGYPQDIHKGLMTDLSRISMAQMDKLLISDSSDSVSHPKWTSILCVKRLEKLKCGCWQMWVWSIHYFVPYSGCCSLCFSGAGSNNSPSCWSGADYTRTVWCNEAGPQ